MVAQAEHSTDSIVGLVTSSQKLIEKVSDELHQIVPSTPRKEIVTDALSNQGFMILCKNLQEAIHITNSFAPEHLEILVEEEKEDTVLDQIENAGAIFIGNYSPVAIGDYSAGSNHVLPTGGAARNYSGLSTIEFMKIIDVVNCTKDGLNKIKDSVVTLARREGLDVHANSVLKRFEEK